MPFFCLFFQPLSAETIKMDLVLKLSRAETTQTRRVYLLIREKTTQMDLV